jgi:hypothetical protein
MNDLQLKEFALANPHLVIQKQSKRYPDLFVVKYKNKVFYDNLWTPELQELRGLVIDKDWNVVVRPFSKIFNRFENGADIPGDEKVITVRKINGFLGCVTYDMKYGLIVSTTGSLDSPFAVLAETHLKRFANLLLPDITYLFEIVDESDPHIIKERLGAYLIGIRIISTGKMVAEEDLDKFSENLNCLRPEWGVRTFNDVLKDVQLCRHEGYVVYGKTVTLKLKSPFYLVKKLFSRVNPEKINNQWLDTAKTWIDEEYYPVVDKIRSDMTYFTTLSPADRREYVESFIGAGLC